MQVPALRPAVVAGSFYEADPERLRAQIHKCFLEEPGPGRLPTADSRGARNIVGLVCPHAGLMYSGYAAAHAYLHLAEDGPVDVAVILCPNHHGMGADNAIWPEGAWETPLGRVDVAADVAEAIRSACPQALPDALAHARDHAIEVQLPFLQVIYGASPSIVPVAMKRYSLADSLAVGEAIASALEGRNGIVIASSDFSHYESVQWARAQDASALQAIEALDPEDLFRRVQQQHITTCGYGPIAAMLAAARRLGARRAQVLTHITSGDISGDYDHVVGYAAVKVIR